MTHDLSFERLEDRQLLAVSVTTGNKGLLVLAGSLLAQVQRRPTADAPSLSGVA